MAFLPVAEQLKIIRRGVSEIVPEAELKQKLEHSHKTGKPLNVKLGVDPTAPDLHLGFTVVIRKLKQFQDLGHQIILIIGDYTATIGDPSGKNKTRPRLSHETVLEHAKSYQKQFFKIVDKDKTRVVFNGEWFAQMAFSEVAELSAQMTVAQMLEREDFSNRYNNGEPISIHEFLYPLMQGWDSVKIKADIELGATDQKFNVLVGRDLQKYAEQPQQIGLFMPILIGTDGENKMSKSLGNYIGISEPKEDMYGKTLSIPDELIYDYFELVTDVDEVELLRIKTRMDAGENPRNLKRYLARTLVRMYYSQAEAEEAEAHFDKIHLQKSIPDDIPEIKLPRGEYKLLDLLAEKGLVESKGQGKRLIQQGGVYVNDHKITDFHHLLVLQDTIVIKAGKRRFLKLSI
jgi:tyrosyl-tRNA synthetase